MAHRDRSRRRILARCACSRRCNFRRKDAIAAALRLWSAAKLLVAMGELADAVLQSRRNADLADTIAERALLAIAANVRRSAA